MPAVVVAALAPITGARAAGPAPGQLYSFGLNYSGELGTTVDAGTGNANPTPELITLPGATGLVARVFAGGSQSFALTTSDQVYTFGSNNLGQLGIATNSGTTTPNPTPTQMALPWSMAGAYRLVPGIAVTTVASERSRFGSATR